MMQYTVRHCEGNRQAWGVYNLDRKPSDYGYCLMTSMSLDLLVSKLQAAFAAPQGHGHIAPAPINIEL